MSISSMASARVQPSFEIVDVNGYKLHTTIEMGEMDCAARSFSSDGMARARIPLSREKRKMRITQ